MSAYSDIETSITSATGDTLSDFLLRLESMHLLRHRRKIITNLPRPYPRFIYKYRDLNHQLPQSVERLKEIILDSKLWRSSPTSFNDPFDMGQYMDVDGTPAEKLLRIRTLVKEFGPKKWKEREQAVRRLMQKTNDELRITAQKSHDKNIADFGVCSFAGDPRSILMWSHYTSHHQGLCLQFDIAENPRVFLRAIPVFYEYSYPVFNWLKQDKSSLALTTKFKNWEYEDERRILQHEAANTYLSFLPSSLSRIIFGCKIRQETVDCIQGILAEREKIKMPPIGLYQATMHKRKYEIVIRKFKA